MKKLIVWILALSMMIGMAGISGAEDAEGAGTSGSENGALTGIFEAGRELILDTDNVTLEGTATFFLEGKEFKRAKGTYIQDGTDAYQRIELAGTDNEGARRQTEYAVLDLNGTGYGSEIYHGKEHPLIRYRVPSSTIMTESRAMHQLLNLTRAACEEADAVLGDRVKTEAAENGGRTTTLNILGEDLPPVADSTLNLLWQFIGSRYYRIGYDRLNISDTDFVVIADYQTPTEGIVMTTRSIELDSAEAEVRQDAEGRITSVSGKAYILLHTGREGQRALEVDFSLTAGQYGTSDVRDNAAVQERMAYSMEHMQEIEGLATPYGPGEGAEGSGTEPAGENAPAFDEAEIPPVPAFEDIAAHRPVTGPEDAIAYAKEIWAMPCFGVEDLEAREWSVTESEHGFYQVWARHPGQVPAHYLQMEIDSKGWIFSLKNAESDLDQAMVTFESRLSDEAQGEYNLRLDGMIRRFADQLNPGYSEGKGIQTERESVNGNYYFGTGDMLYAGENRFILFYSDASLETVERNTRTKVAVQTEPVTRIVYYNELNDPMEGGNG